MSKRTSFREYIEQHGTLTYSNVGVSMMPLLRQGKDLFTVRKKAGERCRAGDVVLYMRGTDRYVLHRVIEVRPDDYVIMGDNCVSREYGIRDEDILGVMTGYVRGGREHSTDEISYRLYTFFIMHTIWFRLYVKGGIRRLYRLLRKTVS